MHSEAKDFGIIAFVDAVILKDFAFSVYFTLHAIVPDLVFERVL